MQATALIPSGILGTYGNPRRIAAFYYLSKVPSSSITSLANSPESPPGPFGPGFLFAVMALAPVRKDLPLADYSSNSPLFLVVASASSPDISPLGTGKGRLAQVGRTKERPCSQSMEHEVDGGGWGVESGGWRMIRKSGLKRGTAKSTCGNS